ncbi:MAG TPA: hypothetical protein VNG11_03250 [Chloroflexota bacterium]|nr:hypothetical protein [Chloroflexota bacterium]
MTEEPRRPRSPRRPPPAPAASESAEKAPPVAASQPVVAPSSYRDHLENEHGLLVVTEAGWPTEYKRFFLVRGQNGTQKRLASTHGTYAEAVAHFYHLLHPEQQSRR